MGLSQSETNRNADTFITEFLNKLEAQNVRIANLEADEGSATSIYPARATMWHDEANIVVGAALSLNHDTNQNYATNPNQNPGADGDTFTHSFLLRAGTYTFSALGNRFAAFGKLDWYIDDVLVISGQDWYGGATTYNVVQSGSVTVVGNGLHKLKGVVNGKNVSSVGYAIGLTKYWIKPATDVSDV